MTDRRSATLLRAAALGAIALMGLACKSGVTCTTELKDGDASFHGSAQAAKEDASLRDNAVRDACRQMCATKKVELVDGCASRCLADVQAEKLGAKTSCN